MYQAVIFDFDYTLGDSTGGIELSINYALETMGYPCQGTDEIKKTIGLSLKDTFEKLTLCKDAEAASRFSVLFHQKAEQVMVSNTVLYRDAKEILQCLKNKGCKTGIVTTKLHYRIEQILDKFEIRNLIDIIVGAEDVKVEKPSPEGLLWAIEHLNINKENVIYVGDSVVDARTAERAGADFAGVMTGVTSRKDFDRFQHVCIGQNLTEFYKNIFNE